jgi:hypothetical protein
VRVIIKYFYLYDALDMTSVLYSAGLNYQAGNPVRSEILKVTREINDIRKGLEFLSDENMILRKYLGRTFENTGSIDILNEMNSELLRLEAERNKALNPTPTPAPQPSLTTRRF